MVLKNTPITKMAAVLRRLSQMLLLNATRVSASHQNEVLIVPKRSYSKILATNRPFVVKGLRKLSFSTDQKMEEDAQQSSGLTLSDSCVQVRV